MKKNPNIGGGRAVAILLLLFIAFVGVLFGLGGILSPSSFRNLTLTQARFTGWVMLPLGLMALTAATYLFVTAKPHQLIIGIAETPPQDGKEEQNKGSSPESPADKFARIGGYVLLGLFGGFIGFCGGYSWMSSTHPYLAVLPGLFLGAIFAVGMMAMPNEFPYFILKRPIQSLGGLLGYIIGAVYGLFTRKSNEASK
jgi:hypothetical protein